MTLTAYDAFRRFLRENNCERSFDRNFYVQCGANRLDSSLADIMVIDESFMSRCFNWAITPEGRQFWKEMDRKWWDLYLTL